MGNDSSWERSFKTCILGFWPKYSFMPSIQVFCTVSEENAPYIFLHDRQFEAKLMMPVL